MSDLQVLVDTLEKKKVVLAEILRLTGEQEKFISLAQPDMESFDRAVRAKEEQIAELEKLDAGFDRLFSRIREELLSHKERYANEIRRMQELIRETMDQGSEIHLREQQNKKTIEQAFFKSRTQIAKNRTANRVAYDYYKAMTSSPMGDPHFMDHKN